MPRSAWGHGYATEAGRAALAVAFDQAEYDEVWSLTATVNRPSRAVMERLGLRHVATQPHPALDAESPISSTSSTGSPERSTPLDPAVELVGAQLRSICVHGG